MGKAGAHLQTDGASALRQSMVAGPLGPRGGRTVPRTPWPAPAGRQTSGGGQTAAANRPARDTTEARWAAPWGGCGSSRGLKGACDAEKGGTRAYEAAQPARPTSFGRAVRAARAVAGGRQPAPMPPILLPLSTAAHLQQSMLLQ